MVTEALNRKVVRVPDVVGRPLEKARILLEDSGLIKIIGTGTGDDNPARYMSVVTALRVMYDRVTGHDKRIDEIDAKVEGALAAVKASSPDPEKIAALVDKAVRDRLAKLAVVDREDASTPEVL